MKRVRTALKAIRAKCLDCSCNQPREVKECRVTSCALWPYRLGRGYQIPPKQGVSTEIPASMTDDRRFETDRLKPTVSAKIGKSPSNEINDLHGDTFELAQVDDLVASKETE